MRQMELQGTCSWIGVPEERYPESRMIQNVQRTYFQTNFNCSGKACLEVAVTAHSRYKLWVNGIYVTFGPSKADHYHQYCDLLELTEYLREGENTILLQVMAYPPRECVQGDQKGPDWSVNKACGCCMLLSGRLLENGRQMDLSTGNYPWYCYFSQELTPHFYAFSQWMGSMEEVDGEKCPEGEALFDNARMAGWCPVKILWSTEPDSYGVLPVFDLYQRQIPFLTKIPCHFQRQNPPGAEPGEMEVWFHNLASCAEEVAIPAHTRAVLELDAGTHKTGLVRFPCRGGAGTGMKITYAESYFLSDEKGHLRKEVRDDWEHGFLYGHSDLYRMREGGQVYEPFWFRTFRFIRLEITTGDTPAAIGVPYFVETRYPLEEKTCMEEDTDP